MEEEPTDEFMSDMLPVDKRRPLDAGTDAGDDDANDDVPHSQNGNRVLTKSVVNNHDFYALM